MNVNNGTDGLSPSSTPQVTDEVVLHMRGRESPNKNNKEIIIIIIIIIIIKQRVISAIYYPIPSNSSQCSSSPSGQPHRFPTLQEQAKSRQPSS